MYSLHCTKKLLDRIKPLIATSPPPPPTVLGNWYATALFCKPQLALLVNERTLLPVLMPLAPSSTLSARFPGELAVVLSRHGISRAAIDREMAAMTEVAFAKTANRSVLGIMNEFSFLAEGYREYLVTSDLLALSMLLADTLQPDQVQQPHAADQGAFGCCVKFNRRHDSARPSQEAHGTMSAALLSREWAAA